MDEECLVEPFEKAVTVQQIRDADRTILSIGGMDCPNCATRIHNSLLAVDGVYRADVYLEFALADVFYDRGMVSAEILQEAVRRASHSSPHNYYALVIVAD